MQQRQNLFTQLRGYLNNAQDDSDNIRKWLSHLQVTINKLSTLALELLDLHKRYFSEKDYKQYKEKIHIYISSAKQQQKEEVRPQSTLRQSRKEYQMEKEIHDLKGQVKNLNDQKKDLEQRLSQYQFREQELSQIQVDSLNSSSMSIEDILIESHNQDLEKMAHELVFKKLDLDALKKRIEMISEIKHQIRVKLRADQIIIGQLNEKLLYNQRKIRRLEEFEYDQIKLIKNKQSQLLLE
ncbi:hypothetical protein pb186bvf_014140 [Paramecium bursaria]